MKVTIFVLACLAASYSAVNIGSTGGAYPSSFHRVRAIDLKSHDMDYYNTFDGTYGFNWRWLKVNGTRNRVVTIESINSPLAEPESARKVYPDNLRNT
jgi:hypothetical protein